ncbi:putative nuclease HARBI1 [Ornithodoros turicata]|uniref:putative nuclease HARBI1 n=1 Tax=Ornithodoros turicata TaxID=34597 RepID=UPI00313860BF
MDDALAQILLEDDIERTFRERSDAFEEHDHVFFGKYRMTKALAHWLCEQLRPTLQPRRQTRTTLSVEKQVLIALRFYATGSFQGAVGSDRDLSVTQGSVSRILFKVTNAIIHRLAPLWIRFPQDPADVRAAMRDFEPKWHMPGVIGCIDGTLIPIIAPSESSGRLQKSAFFSNSTHSTR